VTEIDQAALLILDASYVVLRAPSAEVLPPIVERIKELFAQQKPGGG